MESTNQLILQVFVIFRRGLWPRDLQIAVILSSCLTLCLGMTQEHLQLSQNTLHRKGRAVHRYCHLSIRTKAIGIGEIT